MCCQCWLPRNETLEHSECIFDEVRNMKKQKRRITDRLWCSRLHGTHTWLRLPSAPLILLTDPRRLRQAARCTAQTLLTEHYDCVHLTRQQHTPNFSAQNKPLERKCAHCRQKAVISQSTRELFIH
jgi:hypothetical protein